ncbi:MAG TPA: hypothetical protein VLK56_06170 [Solirubrobacterales bacterium]|nr:hypothetical protein [Solirubrobacterales bacterium]
MAQRRKRTQTCGTAQARQRLAHARSFLEVAELAADVTDPSLEYGSVAVSVAILAGIAAADAACCQELGRRSRSDDHHDAEALLQQITPGGKQAASQLRQLIDVKDTAHYGFISVTTPQLKRSLRQAQQLVEFAEGIVRQSGVTTLSRHVKRSGSQVE